MNIIHFHLAFPGKDLQAHDFYNPSGNALEFKSFKDQSKILATE
jgi:extradiol dioxygenase family protein